MCIVDPTLASARVYNLDYKAFKKRPTTFKKNKLNHLNNKKKTYIHPSIEWRGNLILNSIRKISHPDIYISNGSSCIYACTHLYSEKKKKQKHIHSRVTMRVENTKSRNLSLQDWRFSSPTWFPSIVFRRRKWRDKVKKFSWGRKNG